MRYKRLTPAESAQSYLASLAGVPKRAARLLAERQRALAELERRYPRDVYTTAYIEQRRQELLATYERKLAELRQEAAELEQRVQAAIAKARPRERDPGRETAKARAWGRYAQALEREGPLTLIDVAARDADPVLALEALAEELPAALRLAGRPEPEIATAQAEIRRRLLSLLPDEQRQAAEAEAALERVAYRVGLALTYAEQAASGQWESLPGLPDAEGEGLVPISETAE